MKSGASDCILGWMGVTDSSSDLVCADCVDVTHYFLLVA